MGTQCSVSVAFQHDCHFAIMVFQKWVDDIIEKLNESRNFFKSVAYLSFFLNIQDDYNYDSRKQVWNDYYMWNTLP